MTRMRCCFRFGSVTVTAVTGQCSSHASGRARRGSPLGRAAADRRKAYPCAECRLAVRVKSGLQDMPAPGTEHHVVFPDLVFVPEPCGADGVLEMSVNRLRLARGSGSAGRLVKHMLERAAGAGACEHERRADVVDSDGMGLGDRGRRGDSGRRKGDGGGQTGTE
jgi:hypothetical protein